MFASPKLHYYSITAALATAGGLLAIFLAAGFIFTSDNPVSKSAMLIGGIFLVIGAIEPRRMLLLLVPITFYLDGVKRLLIITGRTGLNDVTSVLAIAPLTAVGVIIGCIIRRIFLKTPPVPVERFAIFGALGAFVAFGGTEIFTAGDLLFSLKTAANTTVYFLLPWVVLQCFRTREEIERFLRYCLIIGLPVALYGAWQYVMGLNQFEIAYLKSGLTTVGDVSLDDIRPRPFSTLASPHPYASVMAFMLVLSAHFAFAWKGTRRNWKGIFVFAIYALALALSMARGATLSAAAMLVYAWLFRTRSGVTIAYLFSAAVIGGLIFFARPLLDSLDTLQTFLPGNADWQEQAFRLGTISDRLMGFENILGKPSNWPLFANPLKYDIHALGYSDAQYSHDLFSQMILRIGAIPVFVGIAVGMYIVWRAHRAIFALPAGKGGSRMLAARIMAILIVFLLSQAGGSGMTVFPINFWLGMFTGLLTIICLRPGTKKAEPVKTEDVAGHRRAEAAPARAGAR